MAIDSVVCPHCGAININYLNQSDEIFLSLCTDCNQALDEPLPVEQSRSCQCGSGQDWWNCSENSPYCG